MNRAIWDNDGFAPRTRKIFDEVQKCGTVELGARMFTSETGEKVLVYFSCKQKLCPSCGHSRTLDWVEEIDRRLPETSYTAVGFSMHSSLWDIFHDNPGFLRDLPALAIGVIQDYARSKYGADIAAVAVTHTFGGDLKFYPHVHAIVSTTGLETMNGQLVSGIGLSKDIVMQRWRHALVAYLRCLHEVGALKSSRSHEELQNIFDTEFDRLWVGKIEPIDSKTDVLNYICRYARRAPFANRYIRSFNESFVILLLKDTKRRKRAVVKMEVGEFLKRIENHIAPHYSHAVHYFGLLGPRSKKHFAIYCAQLRYPIRKPLPRQSWETRIETTFGRRPLIDRQGNRMSSMCVILPYKAKG